MITFTMGQDLGFAGVRTLEIITAPTTVDDLWDRMTFHLEDKFARHGETPPTWMLAHDGTIEIVETAWEGHYSKAVITGLMRTFIRVAKIDFYAFGSEVWVAKINVSDPDYERKSNMRPSELPEREDALMLQVHSRDGRHRHGQYKVTDRKGRGLNFLGPLVEDPDESISGGMLWDLFRDEKDPRKEAKSG